MDAYLAVSHHFKDGVPFYYDIFPHTHKENWFSIIVEEWGTPTKVTSFVQEQMQDQNTNWKEGSGKKMKQSVLKAAQADGAQGSSRGDFGELEDWSDHADMGGGFKSYWVPGPPVSQ